MRKHPVDATIEIADIDDILIIGLAMKSRILIKNHHQEVKLITRRSISILGAMLLLVALLLIRLAYLQLYKHDLYTTLATQNWLDLVPIEPSRGLIYDRNGTLLAENTPIFSLDVMPVKVKNMALTIQKLKQIIPLSNNEIAQFQKQVKQRRRFEEIPIKLRLTEEDVSRFAENQYQFPGVTINARLIRHYPYASHFSHVIGYVGRINAQEMAEIDQVNYSASHYIGKSGIEKYYEEELHGAVGYKEVENDASGKSIRVLKSTKGIPGKNLHLTIDAKLQFAAEAALEGHRGALIAIEPSTGQVLAMASVPSFDPNSFVVGISQADYQVLQQSKDRPLYNRALRGLYAPASTIKPYLAVAALHHNVIHPNDTIYDKGWYQIRNNSHIFHDWKKRGHGVVDLNRAIAHSCDIYFYELGMKLGIKRMSATLSQFGFGSLTGIDLDDELGGILASPEWKQRARGARWYEGDTVNSSIGQGYMQATPLQLATAAATLANRGKRFIPYLLLAEEEPNKPLAKQQPLELDSITLRDEEIWETVINGMKEVVIQGTARTYGRKHTYTIAAKTGTAQVVSKRGNPNEEDRQENLPEKWRDHHLFIAFAPSDKPKIAIAAISENSSLAIEAGRAVIDQYLGEKKSRVN